MTNNPNRSSILTYHGMCAILELAYGMDKNHQQRFARALAEEMNAIQAAFGDGCAIGPDVVERVAQKTK